jgi:hypothetical protein
VVLTAAIDDRYLPGDAPREVVWQVPSLVSHRKQQQRSYDHDRVYGWRRDWRRAPGTETLSLDGTRLNPAGHVGGTRAFSFKMPAQNNWLERPGKRHGRMAVYGAATIFQPLGAGTHTLVQMVRFGHSAIYTTTYQLTVS